MGAILAEAAAMNRPGPAKRKMACPLCGRKMEWRQMAGKWFCQGDDTNRPTGCGNLGELEEKFERGADAETKANGHPHNRFQYQPVAALVHVDTPVAIAETVRGFGGHTYMSVVPLKGVEPEDVLDVSETDAWTWAEWSL